MSIPSSSATSQKPGWSMYPSTHQDTASGSLNTPATFTDFPSHIVTEICSILAVQGKIGSVSSINQLDKGTRETTLKTLWKTIWITCRYEWSKILMERVDKEGDSVLGKLIDEIYLDTRGSSKSDSNRAIDTLRTSQSIFPNAYLNEVKQHSVHPSYSHLTFDPSERAGKEKSLPSFLSQGFIYSKEVASINTFEVTLGLHELSLARSSPSITKNTQPSELVVNVRDSKISPTDIFEFASFFYSYLDEIEIKYDITTADEVFGLFKSITKFNVVMYTVTVKIKLNSPTQELNDQLMEMEDGKPVRATNKIMDTMESWGEKMRDAYPIVGVIYLQIEVWNLGVAKYQLLVGGECSDEEFVWDHDVNNLG